MLSPIEIAEASAGYWAILKKLRLQSGVFSFVGREYQKEIMESESRRICCMKATQLGFTEMAVVRILHGMIFGRYPRGALYLFPTQDDVNEFSKSRFNPLIQNNWEAIGKFVKYGPGGKGRKSTDSAGLKKIHDAWLYLRGARLTQKVGDVVSMKDSSRLKGIPADVVVFDECDAMSSEAIAKALGRLGDSLVNEEFYLSNPTIPDDGIDALFQKSDQRYLQRKCSCGQRVCAEKAFPECVHLRPDGTGFIACPKCGKEVGYKDAEWVPDMPSNSDYMHGYQLSQLSSRANDPAEILADFKDPPQGNLGDVMRLRLGFPFIPTEDRLRVGDVYACCNNDMMPFYSKGPCAMGVDVGKIKHVVIGTRIDDKRFQILKMARLSDWTDIHDLAMKFNVKSAVIDIRPYEDKAREFQKAEPYRIFLCEYSENAMHDAVWDNKTKTVRAYRTGVFDRTHSLVMDNLLVIPRRSEEVERFARQMCGTAKILQTNERTQTSVYRYRKVGPHGDHYRNALNYFFLAASGGHIGRAGTVRNRPKVAKAEYAIF